MSGPLPPPAPGGQRVASSGGPWRARPRAVRRAGDRAGPEPQREAQHRHHRRRRPGRVQPPGRRLREHRGALRRVRAGARPGRADHSRGRSVPRLPQALRPRQRVRRRRREHVRAHPRLRHAAGPATGQARLLREAADAQHLGGAGHPRGRRQGQGRDADGHSDSRQRQLSPRGRADPDRRDRPGHARCTSGSAGPGAGSRRRGRQAKRATSSTCPRAAHGDAARARTGSTGTSGSAPRRPGRSTTSISRVRSGIAGGTSATAR